MVAVPQLNKREARSLPAWMATGVSSVSAEGGSSLAPSMTSPMA